MNGYGRKAKKWNCWFIDFSNNKSERFIFWCCSIMEYKIEVTNDKEIFDQYKNITKRLMKFVKLTE